MFAVHSSDDPDRDLRPYLRIESDRYDAVTAMLFKSGVDAWRQADPVFQAVLESYALHVSPDGLCGGRMPCYAEVQAAVDAADGEVAGKIRVVEEAYPESVVMNTPERIELAGGYDLTFADAWSHSTLSGLEISNGTVVCSGIVLAAP
jgi:hypothetical protein